MGRKFLWSKGALRTSNGLTLVTPERVQPAPVNRGQRPSPLTHFFFLIFSRVVLLTTVALASLVRSFVVHFFVNILFFPLCVVIQLLRVVNIFFCLKALFFFVIVSFCWGILMW